MGNIRYQRTAHRITSAVNCRPLKPSPRSISPPRPIQPGSIYRESRHRLSSQRNHCDHRELALGEIDDAGRAKDQDEAQSDERVDDADAREEQLQKEIHPRRRLERSWL